MHFKKEVVASYRFYNKLNHLSILNDLEFSIKERKLLWYRLVSRKLKKRVQSN